MQIILVGLNHQTAPVAIREQFALARCGLRMALEDLRASRSPDGADGLSPRSRVAEAVVLSTCNRLEVYAVVVDDPAAGWEDVEVFLANLQGVSLDDLHPHLYFMAGNEVFVHLMKVATGLDSMILGEPQILGQVSAAYAEAQAAGASGPLLSHLFERAVHAGKRARSETEIGRHTTSISHAAAQLVKDKLGALEGAQALIVGAGEMAEVAVQALQQHGLVQMSFINRTHARAVGMARQFGGQALNWYHLPAALSAADVIITATGAPHVVIHQDQVREVLPGRNGRPLLFVDIAMPRDVEEAVGSLPGVSRYDIDHLQNTVDRNLAQRQAAVPDVEQIIEFEAQVFEEWLLGRQVLPVLVELRRKVRGIAEEELERHMNRLDELDPDCRQAVALMVRRIVNKMLHEPTVRLKASAAEGDGFFYAQTVRELFDLNLKSLSKPPAGNGHPSSTPLIAKEQHSSI